MAEHNANTVKTQIQSLINLANTTTGNQDTNLTDGVNALVSGYGQGGSGGTLEGLENGYDVMFYDENNEGLAFYSIRQGDGINAPVYEAKNWLDKNGNVIVFPYIPINDIELFADNSGYVSKIYEKFGVNPANYPYLFIMTNQVYNKVWIYFCDKWEQEDAKVYAYKEVNSMMYVILDASVYHPDIDTIMTLIQETTKTLVENGNSYYGVNVNNGGPTYHKIYTNVVGINVDGIADSSEITVID